MSESLPLITANTLKAARLSSSASERVQAPSRTEEVSARVITSQTTSRSGDHSKGTHYQLTVELNGRRLTLESEYPLPPESRLKLAIDINNNRTSGEQVSAVRVLEIIPPPSDKAVINSQTTSTSHSNTAGDDTAVLLQRIARLLHHTTRQTTDGPPAGHQTATDQPTQTQINRWLAQKLPLLQQRPGKAAANATALYQAPARQHINANTSNANTTNANTTNANTTNVTAISTSYGSSPDTSAQPRLLPLLQQLLASELPDKVRQPLQQLLHNPPQPDTPGGARAQINNSGLTFENKLVSGLLQLANNNDNNSQPAQAQSLLNRLWQAPIPAKDSATTLQPPQTAAAKPATQGISALLLATRQRLEQSLKQASSDPAESPADTEQAALTRLPSSAANTLLSGLLQHDHKAVLSRSLQLWLAQLNQTQVKASSQTGTSSTGTSPVSSSDPAGLPNGVRLLQTALAQIEVEQIQRLQQPEQQWQINLPLLVRHDGVLQEVRLHLQRQQQDDEHPQRDTKKVTQWRLHLHFDLPRLGPLDVAVDMRLPQLSATFWSETRTTLASLNSALQPLHSRLSQMGVEVDSLAARYGRLPETQHNQIHTGLVDCHT
ncbi:flagellar hook-length control protein FliK [Bacterioplanoides pacificum]